MPRGLQQYWKAAFVGDVTAEAIQAHMEHGSRVPVVNSTVQLYPTNIARVRRNRWVVVPHPRVNYDTLREVKRAYDPGNRFHLNQNIQPSAS